MNPRYILTTEARMPMNSEAIGVIFISRSVPISSYAWSRRRRTTTTRNTVRLGTSLNKRFVLHNHAVL